MSTSVLIRPRRSLLSTALVSIVFAMLPVFGVLYWFAFQHDAWPLVFAVHLAVVLAALALLVRQLTVRTAVTDTELMGSGIFSRLERVPLDRIAEVLVIETHVGQAPETVTQVLVRDAGGGVLFRLRGNFWHASDLDALISALPVPPTVVATPMSLAEFFRAYPGSAYWFENRPWLLTGSIAAGFALVALAVFAVVGGLGLPFG